MPYHTPERKTEQALKNYFPQVLGYEIGGVQFVTRFCNAVLTEPRVEIAATDVSPFLTTSDVQTGLWNVTLTIKVVTHYEKEVDAVEHDNLVGNLVDKLLIIDANGQDALENEINGAQLEEYFYVFKATLTSRRNNVEDHSIVTEQDVEMLVRMVSQTD
jgi:hypothetical protein